MTVNVTALSEFSVADSYWLWANAQHEIFGWKNKCADIKIHLLYWQCGMLMCFWLNIATDGEPIVCKNFTQNWRTDLAIAIQIKVQLISTIKPWKNLNNVVESVTVCSNFLTSNFI